MLLDWPTMEVYTTESIPALKKKQREENKKAKEYEKTNDDLKNPHQDAAFRLKKAVGLLQHGLNVEDYSPGQVLVNKKFVVSLSNNKWRIVGKQTWYDHRHDLTHFVCNYILKEDFKKPPTPEQELDYFQAKLKELFSKKPDWLIKEIRKAVQDENPNL